MLNNNNNNRKDSKKNSNNKKNVSRNTVSSPADSSKKNASTKSKTLYYITRTMLFAEVFALMLLVMLLVQIKMIPTKFIVIGSIILILLFAAQVAFLFMYNNKKSKKAKKRKKASGKWITSIVISVLVILLSSGSMYYIKEVYQVFKNLEASKMYATIDFIVLNTSTIGEVKDFSSTDIAGIREFVDEENSQKALSEISTKTGFSFQTKTYIDFGTQIKDLYKGKIQLLAINDSFIDLINEEIDSTFKSKIKIIYQAKIEAADTPVTNGKDITKDSFTVLLSGLDNRGKITEQGRSDVNILVTINPKTKTILMTNIPRDFYVPLNGDTTKMDKLTHAGIYGIDCSMNTISNLLDVDVDYYVKVGFNSVIDIVDAIGGITVNSPYAFTGYDDYKDRGYIEFNKGKNKLDGLETLVFVRHRRTLPNGDRDRGKNQQIAIEAILDKMMSPSVLGNFSKIMDAISKNCKMSLTQEDIAKLVQMQLTDGASWTIQSTSVNGKGASKFTYSYGNRKLYVMIPTQSTVDAAKQAIKDVITPPAATTTTTQTTTTTK